MAELPPGAVFAGCRVEAVAGRGGMGVVYRATQLSLDRAVALKAIAPEFADDVMFRERFKRESRIAASIEHPNVIPVYEAGEGEGTLYLIMRYIEGTDLRALIDAEGGLDPTRAARIVAQVAQALAAAHRRDLLHRDVKPANVLLDRVGGRDHAYLTDFGVARSAGASSGLTRTGAVLGTVDYLAPERIQEQGGDGRSDVYALGCVMFEALTGRVPYERDNEMAKMYAHMSAPVPSVRELSSDVPEELDALTRQAMAKDPAERIESAEALAGALGELTKPRATTAQESPRTPPAAALPPEAPRGRRRTPLLAAGGVLVAALAVVLVLVLSGGGSSSSSGSPAFRQAASAQIGAGPDGMALDNGTGTLWIANNSTDAAIAVDPERLRQRARVALGGEPDSVAVGFGSVWVTKSDADSVAKIDATSRAVTRTIPVGEAPEGIAVSDEFVWVVNGDGNSVTRVDQDGDVAGTTEVGTRPVQAAVAGDGVWVTLSHDDRVIELDARTGEPIAGHVAKIQGQPRGIAFDGTRLWIAATGANAVASFRPDDPANVARIEVPSPREVAVGLGAVWVTTGDDGNLVAIDPKARREVGRFPVGAPTFGVAVGGGAAWSASGDGHLIKVQPD
jgi:YVTN family beta-propeller protein